jgi:type II secretion system protein J
VRRELLTGVQRIDIRYMDKGRQWVEQWPPLGSTDDVGFYERPLAVEVTLVLSDYGELKRLVEVPG